MLHINKVVHQAEYMNDGLSMAIGNNRLKQQRLNLEVFISENSKKPRK